MYLIYISIISSDCLMYLITLYHISLAVHNSVNLVFCSVTKISSQQFGLNSYYYVKLK